MNVVSIVFSMWDDDWGTYIYVHRRYCVLDRGGCINGDE